MLDSIDSSCNLLFSHSVLILRQIWGVHVTSVPFNSCIQPCEFAIHLPQQFSNDHYTIRALTNIFVPLCVSLEDMPVSLGLSYLNCVPGPATMTSPRSLSEIKNLMNWEIGPDIYTLLFIKQISNETLLHGTLLDALW